MAIKTYNDQNFVAIANAIRAKNGETTQYKPSEMAAAISALETALEILPQDTVSGAIANFPDGSNNYPVVELIANIDPKQAGSGDPSPSNVRPISGSTEVTIVKQGKNLITLPTYTENTPSLCLDLGRDITFSSVTLSFLATNAIAASTNAAIVDYRKDDGTHQYRTLNWFKDENNVIFRSDAAQNGRFSNTYANVTFRYIYIYYQSANYSIFATDCISNWQLEVGSTVTAYEPYQAETKTIDLGRTVYSGTLNVTTGVLTVNRKYKIFTGAESEEWSFDKSGDYYRFRTPISDIKIEGAGRKEVLSNIGFYSSSSAYYVIFGYRSTTVNYIYYYAPSGIETVADFKSWLSANNMQVVYDIETPEVYQLEPEEVRTLLGVNNINADTGDVEVTYRADIDLYIAKKIAEGA